MENINRFNDIINYIEDNFEKEIEIDVMAKAAQMSVYEFRRIFSFVAGVPVSEYIRKRRLSAAAEELMSGEKTVTEVALKYGYDSASSFSRAFKAFHGVAPTEISKSGSTINMYTRIGFDFSVKGGNDIPYRIICDSDFYICGLSEVSDIEDTECCEKVWNDFYEKDSDSKIISLCGDKIYAAYTNGTNSVNCCIGARCNEEQGDCIYVPKSRWACFDIRGAEDEAVNKFYNDIVCRWLESGSYVRNDALPNIEVFPVDMEDDDFAWEIRIPIKVKE